MEDFKVENFINNYSNEEFPWFRSLPKPELDVVTEKMCGLMRASGEGNLIDLVKKIIKNGEYLKNFNAENDDFSLLSVFKYLDITPLEKVFINWYRFDDIDEIHFEDLNKYFDDIWYPGPDDIDIFDNSFSWVLSISHEGDVLFNDLTTH
jgi:hypothetical protein